MAVCKNCGKDISTFDSDICPYCGFKSPIDKDYQTMDITRNISKQQPSYQLYKSKKQSVLVILCAFLGIFGIDYLYLGFKNKFFIKLCINLGLIVGIGLVLLITGSLSFYGFIIPAGVIYLLHIAYAFLILRNKDSIKDSSGEYLH